MTIDYRFKEQGGIKAEDFAGIILIDELEQHLHPKWQGKILGVLRRLLPQAQIFATTHSAGVLQGAGPGEVISLTRSEDGLIEVRRLPQDSHGFWGWSQEEILTEIMGLDSLNSPVVDVLLQRFEQELCAGDRAGALKVRDELQELLNPGKLLSQVLEIEAVGAGHSEICSLREQKSG